MSKNPLLLNVLCLSVLTLAALNLMLWFPEIWYIVLIIYIAAVAAVIIPQIAIKKSRVFEKNFHTVSLYMSLLENIGAMVVIWDNKFINVVPNAYFTEHTGYTKSECRDLKVLKNILPEKCFSKKGIQELINVSDIEFDMTDKNGDKRKVIWNTSVLRHGKNNNLMLSIGWDYTHLSSEFDGDRFESGALSDSEKYTLSMQLSEIGILLKKPESDEFFISEQIQKNLGLSGETVSVKEMRNLIYPKDRVIFDAYCMDNGRYDSNEIHNLEMRIMCADGQYHWFEFRYKKSQSIDGRSGIIGGAMIDITKDKEKDSLIERMAYIDETTQIYNRNKFMMIGQEMFELSENLSVSYWLLVLDIDKFHIINDTCGYQNGNILLKEFAGIITRNVVKGGFAARIGGDDFALIFKNIDNDAPARVIRNIQNELSEFAQVAFPNMAVTCSASFCIIPTDGKDFAHCLDHAVFALSLNSDVRSDVQRYDNKIHDKIIKGSQLEAEIGKAIDNNEFVLYYQPKIDLATGQVNGMEALIRWIRDDGTIVPPSYFIPVAEQSMMITRISRFVLREACRQNKEWQDMGYQKFPISVNLTSVDFYQTNLLQIILDTLEETGLEAKYLEIELTERLALKDIDQAVKQMEEIKKLGVTISMDDFGTGYSSLSYIQVLPITLLKLDRSFIMYLEEDEVSREIVSAVIRIAKSKKIGTIAEGIETSQQAEILKESGCDNAQGYFFGKPMPPEKLQEFLEERMTVLGNN